jgi:hypothetical protein
MPSTSPISGAGSILLRLAEEGLSIYRRDGALQVHSSRSDPLARLAPTLEWEPGRYRLAVELQNDGSFAPLFWRIYSHSVAAESVIDIH